MGPNQARFAPIEAGRQRKLVPAPASKHLTRYEVYESKSNDPGEQRTYHHGELRRALIGAASELVIEEREWTFSLREVARRAGVSHNAPYNYFADKRALLAAIAEAGFLALHGNAQVDKRSAGERNRSLASRLKG